MADQTGSAVTKPYDSLDGWGSFATIIAFLTLTAAVIVGCELIVHTTPNCTAFGCYGKTHPYVGSGIAVLIGGTVQAAIIWIVAKLCHVASDLRRVARGEPMPSASSAAEFGPRD